MQKPMIPTRRFHPGPPALRLVRCRWLLVGAALLSTGPAFAAQPIVAFLKGTVEAPADLNEGDSLKKDEVIRTGTDGLIIVEYRWPSDIQGYICLRSDIFGGGQAYTVGEPATPGRCDVAIPDKPIQPAQQPFLARTTRYGASKTDNPNLPAKVVDSKQRWRSFTASLNRAERSFTGKVESVSGNRISVRSSRSLQVKEFTVPAGTSIVGASSVAELANRHVRVDSRYGNVFRVTAITR